MRPPHLGARADLDFWMGLGLAEQVIGESLDRAAAESAVYKADARRPRAVSGPSRPFRLKLGLPAPPEASGGGWRPLGRSLRRRWARWRSSSAESDDSDDV